MVWIFKGEKVVVGGGVRGLHEANCNFQDIIAQEEIGEIVPNAFYTLRSIAARVEKGFAAVVEARHC